MGEIIRHSGHLSFLLELGFMSNYIIWKKVASDSILSYNYYSSF